MIVLFPGVLPPSGDTDRGRSKSSRASSCLPVGRRVSRAIKPGAFAARSVFLQPGLEEIVKIIGFNAPGIYVVSAAGIVAL